MENKEYILYDSLMEREVGSTNDKQIAIDFLTNENFYIDKNDKDEFKNILLKDRAIAKTSPFGISFDKDCILEEIDKSIWNQYDDFEDQTEFGDNHYQKIIKDEEFQKRLNNLIEYLNNKLSDSPSGAYTYNWISLEKLRGEK